MGFGNLWGLYQDKYCKQMNGFQKESPIFQSAGQLCFKGIVPEGSEDILFDPQTLEVFYLEQ